MGVHIRFIGFHTVYKSVKNGLTLDAAGRSSAELVDELIQHYGPAMAKELKDPRGEGLDPVIQVKVNERFLDGKEVATYQLRENDKVTFLKLISGG